MATRRTIRVSEVLRKELSMLFMRCKDLENRMVTISAVDISPDLRQAFIYISLLDDSEENLSDILGILASHRREWQSAIAKRVKIKNTPHLNFRYDPSVSRGDRVMAILEEIKQDALPEEEEQ